MGGPPGPAPPAVSSPAPAPPAGAGASVSSSRFLPPRVDRDMATGGGEGVGGQRQKGPFPGNVSGLTVPPRAKFEDGRENHPQLRLQEPVELHAVAGWVHAGAVPCRRRPLRPGWGRSGALPSPRAGWTVAETAVLRYALMKYGVGNWKTITAEKVLPGKTVAQLVCQTQRLLGQQSLKGARPCVWHRPPPPTGRPPRPPPRPQSLTSSVWTRCVSWSATRPAWDLSTSGKTAS